MRYRAFADHVITGKHREVGVFDTLIAAKRACEDAHAEAGEKWHDFSSLGYWEVNVDAGEKGGGIWRLVVLALGQRAP